MAGREDTNMMMTGQQDMVEDRIQPRSHHATEKIEVTSSWATSGPDEVTVRDSGTLDSEKPSYAELIRLMTANYRERQRH